MYQPPAVSALTAYSSARTAVAAHRRCEYGVSESSNFWALCIDCCKNKRLVNRKYSRLKIKKKPTEMSKRKWDVAAAPTKMDSNVQSAALAVQRVAARINAKTTDGALVHTKDIAINDLKSRYLLTKASFQHQVRVDTGATVLTKGKYYPDPFLASERDPPMYLHVAATSQQALAMALAMIDHLIDNPNLPIFDSDVNGKS